MPKPPSVFGQTTTTNRKNAIRVRVDANEQADFNHVAKLAGISTSSWCRMILREAAAEKLTKLGLPVTFMPTN